jgi:RNA polymerase sigma-70 factor (ECF subfamily)
MSDSAFNSVHLRTLLDRIRAGDPSARDDLLRATQGRLEQLARRMLRRFPRVRRPTDTADVYQNAVLRLLRALDAVRPDDTRGFMNLAAAQIRRELLDLARHYGGPHGLGANHASVGPNGQGLLERPDRDPGAAEMDRWAAFHEAVERLPAEEREVFGLTYYHGWTQAQVADLFGVDERTVRRRWRAACLALNEALGGELPGG